MKTCRRKPTNTFEICEIDRRAFLKLAAAAGLVSACGMSALEAGTECTERRNRKVKPEDLVGYCGIYCGACARWREHEAVKGCAAILAEIVECHNFKDLASHHGAEFDYKEFRKGLDFLARNDTWFVCQKSCRDDEAKAGCPLRKCCNSRGLDVCFECDEFPCDRMKEMAAAAEGEWVRPLMEAGKGYRELGKTEWLRRLAEKAEQGFEFHTKKYYQARATKSPPLQKPGKSEK